METEVRAHYEKVQDAYTEEEFLEKLERMEQETGGLLQRDVLAAAIADEAGVGVEELASLGDLEGRDEATLHARVADVGEARAFRRGGRDGRVVNLVVHDGEGQARLVLWDDDVDRVTDGSLELGTIVKIVNARVKRSGYGTELHIGRWSMLEVPDPDELPGEVRTKLDRDLDLDATPPEAGLDAATPLGEVRAGDDGLRVEARVQRVEPTRSFDRRDGSTGFLAKAHLDDGTGQVVLTAWDDHAAELQELTPGTAIVATGLRAKEFRGTLELHTSYGTTLEAAEPS